MSMRTSLEDIRRWFKTGVEEKATHMIIVCDTFHWEDYPVYVSDKEDVKEQMKEYNPEINMQKIMEVYDLRKSMEEQLKPGTRVFNY
jgi:hypothetical protein